MYRAKDRSYNKLNLSYYQETNKKPYQTNATKKLIWNYDRLYVLIFAALWSSSNMEIKMEKSLQILNDK